MSAAIFAFRSCAFFTLTVFILVGKAERAFSQETTSFKQRRDQIDSDLAYLKLNSIQLYNLIPFTENGKLGVKNLKSEIVLPAIYDSIKAADPNRFIVVKGNRAQLFTYDLISCFDSTVVSIQLHNWSYIVKDDKGVISQYSLVHHSNQLLPLDAKVNHLVYAEASLPVNESTVKSNMQTRIIASNPYLDSIQIMFNSNAAGDEEIRFYKQEKQIYRKIGNAHNFEILASRFLSFETGKRESASFEVFDLKNNHSFTIRAKNLEFIIYNGNDCLLAYVDLGDFQGLRVYDAKGEMLHEIMENVVYQSGFLFKETAFDRQTMTQLFDMYSFPDMELIDTDIRNPGQLYPGLFSTYNKGKDLFRFYFRGKFIYEMSGKTFESIEGGGIYPNSDKGLILIKTKSKTKYRLITTGGKLVAEYKRGVRCFYQEQFGQVEVHVSRNTKAYSESIGFYDTISEKINFVPFPDFYWQWINANTLLYDFTAYNKKNDSYSREIYLMDLNGKRLDDRHFTDAKILHEYSKVSYIMLEENGIPKLYDKEMKLVCDSCFLYDYAPFKVLYSDPDDLKTEIIYQGEKRVLPVYLAVIPSYGYFIALTKDRKIEYIPYK